jgi:hypothetical protein
VLWLDMCDNLGQLAIQYFRYIGLGICSIQLVLLLRTEPQAYEDRFKLSIERELMQPLLRTDVPSSQYDDRFVVHPLE